MKNNCLSTIGIVQARMGSSRFPLKMMANLAGRPIIDWVITRVMQADRLDKVILATSKETIDDELAEFAAQRGVNVFRGSEADVLGRIWNAVRLLEASAVVRICADNPFVDSREINRLVNFFYQNNPDYAFNHLDQSANGYSNGYADGFGAEIISIGLLSKLVESVSSPEEREHMTLAVWNNANNINIQTFDAPNELRHPELHFDVDTNEDLRKLDSIARSVGILGSASDYIRAFGK